MRVGKKYLFLLIVLLFVLISFKLVSACYNKGQPCSSDSECCSDDCDDMDGVCVGNVVCGDNNVEGNEVCDGNSGCPDNYHCNSDCSKCIADFTVGNGVCEYGAGERMTSSLTDGWHGTQFCNDGVDDCDDCDQDNDGLFDNCADGIDNTCIDKIINDVVFGVKNEAGIRLNYAYIDFCPGSDGPVDSIGCTCYQKQNDSFTGVSSCSELTFDCVQNYNPECVEPDSISFGCTRDHPACFTQNDLNNASLLNQVCNVDFVSGDCTDSVGNQGTCDNGVCVYCPNTDHGAQFTVDDN